MKTRFPLVPLFVAALLAGCGQKAPSAATAATAPPAPAAPAPVGPRVIEITGNDQMKFSVTAIEVKVGEEIKVVLKNVGTLPKQAMGHNWILLKMGSDAAAFSAAAVAALDKDYIPDSHKDQVIVHTKLLGPNETEAVTFKLTAAGEYPFLCSFPAHFMVGMKGVITAK